MRIRRQGAFRNRGSINLLPECRPSISWGPANWYDRECRSDCVVLKQTPVRDYYNSDAHHDWTIDLTIHDVAKIVHAVAEGLSKHGEQIGAAMKGELLPLLKLLAAATGLIATGWERIKPPDVAHAGKKQGTTSAA